MFFTYLVTFAIFITTIFQGFLFAKKARCKVETNNYYEHIQLHKTLTPSKYGQVLETIQRVKLESECLGASFEKDTKKELSKIYSK